MEKILLCVVFFLSLIKGLVFYQVIYGVGIKLPKWHQFFPIFCFLMFYLFLRDFEIHSLVFNFFPILAVFYSNTIFSGMTFRENLKYGMIHFLADTGMELSADLFLYFFVPSLAQYEILNEIVICLIVILLYSVLFLFPLFRSGRKIDLSGKNSLLLLFSFFVFVIYLEISFMVLRSTGNEGLQKAGYLMGFLAAMVFCVLFVVLLSFSRQREFFEKQADLENKYSRQQRQYFQILLEKERETRKYRHDMMNHLIILDDLALHHTAEEIHRYLEEHMEVLRQIREKEYSVGNEIIDIFLNTYLFPLKKNCQIHVEGVIGTLEGISRMDLCTIFSNLIKNAAEAVGKIPEESIEERRISVLAYRGEAFVRMEIKNTFFGEIRIEDGQAKTDKQDVMNHGFGLENVRQAVERCRGDFDYQISEKEFTAICSLPLKVREK